MTNNMPENMPESCGKVLTASEMPRAEYERLMELKENHVDWIYVGNGNLCKTDMSVINFLSEIVKI